MNLKGYTIRNFDRGASRVKEALWYIVRALFFTSRIPLPSSFRVRLLRLFGAKIGSGVVVRSNVNVTYPWRLTVGDDVWIGDDVLIISHGSVTIESSVCISQRAFLCAGSHRFHSPGFDLITKPIIIRRGSWIASMAFVAMGVEIGPDSMVGAGAVVIGNVLPGTTVIGNPAQVKTP